MQIGPRYKKARYLGAPVFRKTQTQKFAMRSEGGAKGKGSRGPRGGKSEYGRQLLEKQKARFSYGIGGRQFTNYVKSALQTPGDNAKNLLSLLERRLDNVVLRAGFATSRSAARQMVSHGHILVNGKATRVPSYAVSVGDVLTIREGSKGKGIFAKLDDVLKEAKTPAWIKVDGGKREIKVDGMPAGDSSEALFDISSVLQFYTR